jgi:phosphoglycolate phosphatase-like HAD superfamily hydrolase
MVNKINFSKFSYLISDWDGTLADSFKPHTESFIKTVHDSFGVGKEKAKEIYFNTDGKPLTLQIKKAAKTVGFNVSDTLPYEDKFWENLKGLMPETVPGAKEFLTLLKNKGFKIAVWSGTKTDILHERIDLLSFFSLVDFYIGNEPGNKTQVKGPFFFTKIAERFGIPEEKLREKALVIGDGTGDMEAGKAVGATTVGIARKQPKEQLIKAGADMVVMDIEELGRLFK